MIPVLEEKLSTDHTPLYLHVSHCRGGEPRKCRGNSSAVKVSGMLSLCSAVINPRPDLGNRVVSREPGGIFPSITFYYIPSKVTQASTEPRESQIAPLHSKHCNFQQVSWGHPAQSYFLPPSLMLSLRALHCCSCLSLPAHTIPNLGSFLHPPLPVPNLCLMICSHLLGYSQHHVPKIHQAERL